MTGPLTVPLKAALRLAVLLAFLVPSAFGSALAQDEGQDGEKSNMFAGFGSNSDEPYEILADELQVFDNEKYAVLTGNVSVRQESSLMKTPYLKVFYSGQGTAGGGADSGAAGDNQGIRRLEARQGVYVESGTQIATGDQADYNAETEVIELSGNVVLQDDGNVIKGEKLTINLRTGESRVTSPGQRIRMLLKPNSGNTQ